MTRVFLIKFFFFSFAFSLFVPTLGVAGLGVRVEDILALLFMAVVVVLVKKQDSFKVIIPISPLVLFFVLFLFLGVIQSYEYTNWIKPPTELWQYLKRVAFFLSGVLFYFYLDEDCLEKYSFWIFLIYVGYLLVGVLQILSGPLGDYLSGLYARSVGQGEASIRVENKRVLGVSGFSTSWGGVSGFFFLSGVFYLWLSVKSHLKIVLLSTVLFVLAFLNVFSSGSRAAIGAFCAVLAVSLIVMSLAYPKKTLKYSLMPIVLLVCFGFYFLARFYEEILFVIYRFDVLAESSGGGRLDQIDLGLSLVDSSHAFCFGVSNAVQRALGVSHGIEVEPVNLFVNYGFFGLLLLYCVFFLLLFEIYLHCRKQENFFPFMIISTVIAYYLVFSLGYFFYAELVVGGLPWLFFGSVYGYTLRR